MSVTMGSTEKHTISDKTTGFWRLYGNYFKTKSNDTDLLHLTTQPFWQSMRLSKRRFFCGNKQIYYKMEPEISTMSLLQTDTTEDYTYKVSGFFLEENTWKKLRNTIKKTLMFLGILTAVLMGIAFIGTISAFGQLMMGINNMGTAGTLAGAFAAIDLFPLGRHEILDGESGYLPSPLLSRRVPLRYFKTEWKH